MNLITLDFETYYDKKYSLGKMTMESYIRDPQFEVIGVGVKFNAEETEWASGTHEQIKEYLDTYDWDNALLLAHNTMFDGAILAWLFDITPSRYTDTVCIARALHGNSTSVSLNSLSELYEIGVKGEEVQNTIGRRRGDFSEEQLDEFGDYCINDVELTFKLFKLMGKDFPRKELRVIDKTLRMFIQPTLQLDLPKLNTHLCRGQKIKEDLITSCGVTKVELMSNPKFAEALQALGVEPPKKISPTTGKETLALAKTDEGFKKLLEHEDEKVRRLVKARLEVKGTLEETRTERFIGIAERGSLPVPIRYYAAHTGRWGGDDKINLQNLPSRGQNAKVLEKAILAPEGYSLIDCDSSQIEARVLAWLAEQDDLVKAFANKEDVYVKMASTIYDVDEEDVTKEQRFVGKTTILGAGYGMGAERFKDQLKTFGVDMDIAESRRVVKIYREANAQITTLWFQAQQMLEGLLRGDMLRFGRNDLIRPIVYQGFPSNYKGIVCPSGLAIRYNNLRRDGEGEVTYATRNGRAKLYGGKIIENVCQAFARCIIAEQLLDIAKKYRVVLTVHDSIVCSVPDEELEAAKYYVERSMRKTPDWAKGLPLDCEAFTGKSYGDCGE